MIRHPHATDKRAVVASQLRLAKKIPDHHSRTHRSACADDTDRPLAFFKIKTGVETSDLFAFLNTEPNAEVGAMHPKAMPVILTKTDEIETWMTAPWEQAKALQQPLPDGALIEVARGVKNDSFEASMSCIFKAAVLTWWLAHRHDKTRQLTHDPRQRRMEQIKSGGSSSCRNFWNLDF